MSGRVMPGQNVKKQKIVFKAGNKSGSIVLDQGELNASTWSVNSIKEFQGSAWRESVRALSINRGRLTKVPDDLDLLPNLEELNLQGNDIKSMQGVEKAARLTRLDASYNPRMAVIEGLASSTNLSYLDLSGCGIVDLSGLDALTNLETLHLRENQLTSTSGLGSLHKLTFLDLGQNKIREVVGLDPLENLVELDLSENGFDSIAGLLNLKKLEVLHLELVRKIVDYSGLEKLVSLREISLKSNPVDKSILPILSRLPKLEYLDIDHCEIEDIFVFLIESSNGDRDGLHECLSTLTAGKTPTLTFEEKENFKHFKKWRDADEAPDWEDLDRQDNEE